MAEVQATLLGNSSDGKQALHLLKMMMLIRRFEEKAMECYGKEKIRGFLHLYDGEEAVAVGVISQLTHEDRIISTYREHGHALARGIDPNKIMAELYGKKEGCSGGRGGSMHLFDISRNFFGGNAIVGGHLPMAVGMALADKRLTRKQITCCFFGEGAVAEGTFHEAMNLAGLWNVPILFVLENNLYAMGTSIHTTLANKDFRLKAISYGIDFFETDGMVLNEVIKYTSEAIKKIREQQNAALLVLNTYRFRAHSMFDAEQYRKKQEVDQWKLRDPIILYSDELKKKSFLNDQIWTDLSVEIEKVLAEAVNFAEAGTLEGVDDVELHLTGSHV